MLHLLNYDHQHAAKNVKVRLELNGFVHDLSDWEIKVLSPDTPQPRLAELSLQGKVASFTLGEIEHYSVVTLSAKPER